ncbi:MAG: lipopolysaccharide heptosyltransferase II [Pseudolabrys sp.]|nr:lipopolysaccharide heptosyltransferase II [Pseudolabrys sp.]
MTDTRSHNDPVLIVPWFWIGDFVRAHSVVSLLRTQQPERPVDLMATPLTAPLADYMPGVRKAIVSDLPRRRLALAKQRDLADHLRAENYGQAIVMPRKWKAALAPSLAGIPKRTGFFGEARLGLINDFRSGEKTLPRMIDQMGTLALPAGAALPANWPLPELRVPAQDVAAWRALHGVVPDGRPVIVFAPGAVGAGKAWPSSHYASLAKTLAKDDVSIWVVGGPSETPLAAEIKAAGGEHVRDLTSNDLRNAILGMAAATVAVTNDSGLMHIAAAIGTPTVAIFGPTSPWHWRPLNPLAAILEPPTDAATIERMKTEGNRAVADRRTADVTPAVVAKSVRAILKT